MRNILLVVGLAMAMVSCQKNNSDISGPEGPFKDSSIIDARYGEDPLQSMDVYLPENRTGNTRLIVMIHGGGWSAGDKSEFAPYITELKRRLPGYALANINYRLLTTSTNRFPTQENDTRAAVEFLLSKSGDYHISREMIFLGASAGAHLALLQGYKHTDIVQPKGIVSFFGPVDLVSLYDSAIVSSIPWKVSPLMGFTPEQNQEIYYQSSPINYINAQSAPTLILHGDKDDIVPVHQAVMLHEKLDSVNVRNQLVVYPGLGHGWTGDFLSDSFTKIEAFIKSL